MRPSRIFIKTAAAAGGAISGAATLTLSTTGVITGRTSLVGNETLTFSPTAIITGQTALTASETLTFSDTAALSGLGGLATSESFSFSSSGNLAGTGSLAANEPLAFTTSGTLVPPAGAMSAASALEITTSGNLKGLGSLAGAELITFSDSATLSTQGGATTITVSGITGGADLTSLSYVVFNQADIGSASIIKQANDETTDSNGDLVIDLTGLGVSAGTVLSIVITNYTTAPAASNRGAVCFGTAA
jgi:hypothetical protein